MALRTRKPTGRVPWPFVLVEGPEKSGKSWAAAELSASTKVGQTYWIDLGEGAADEYGAIGGARYEIIEHDGSWPDILGQVKEARDEARRAADAGEPPVVLVIDSMTAEWDLLKAWANQRALKSAANQKRLKADPNAEVLISMNLWNAATDRHKQLMTILLTFPGIVIATARGKQVAAIDDSGKPVEGTKDYKVEGHKNLVYDASVVVRLSNQPKTPPVVVSARSVKHGLRPGVDEPVPVPNFTLEWLIFDALGCDPTTAHPRDLKELDGGGLMPEEMPNDGKAAESKQEFDEGMTLAAAQILEDAEKTTTREAMEKLWEEAKASNLMLVPLNKVVLHKRLTEQVNRIKASMNGHVNGTPVGIGS